VELTFESGIAHKIDRHDIAEILLKVVLDTINQPFSIPSSLCKYLAGDIFTIRKKVNTNFIYSRFEEETGVAGENY
jgi:hypothetical protein